MLPSLRLILLAGSLLGALSWLSDGLPDGVASSDWGRLIFGLGNVPGPWLIVAFAVGASAATVVGGMRRGAGALMVAVVVYYAATALGGTRGDVSLVPATLAWLVVAAVAGPFFGAAGAVWRGPHERWRPVGVGLLAGALLAEAWVLAGELLPYGGFDAGEPTFQLAIVDVLAAAVLPVVLLPAANPRWAAAGLAVVAGVAGVAVLEGTLALLRLIGA